MKKQKINFTQSFLDPFFNSKIMLIFGDTKYRKSVLHKKFQIEDDNIEYDGQVSTVENAGIYEYIFFIDNTNWNYRIKDYAVIVHEVYHLMFRIQENLRSNDSRFALTDDLQEHCAYLSERLFEDILKIITKKLCR